MIKATQKKSVVKSLTNYPVYKAISSTVSIGKINDITMPWNKVEGESTPSLTE